MLVHVARALLTILVIVATLHDIFHVLRVHAQLVLDALHVHI